MIDTDICDENNEKSMRVLKVLVCGEMGCGKTQMIRLYVQGFFSQFYKSTIGVDFATKDLDIYPEFKISLQLWDIAGQERYTDRAYSRVYTNESSGAFIIFDVSRPNYQETTLAWKEWLSDVLTSDGQPIPIMLIGSIFDDEDNPKQPVATDDEFSQFAAENGFLGYYQFRARFDPIDTAVRALVEHIVDNRILPAQNTSIDLTRQRSKCIVY